VHDGAAHALGTPARLGRCRKDRCAAAGCSDDYDLAIAFFVGNLGFELVVDEPGLLLAQADGEGQKQAVGHHFAGRVSFFLRVDDFPRRRTNAVRWSAVPHRKLFEGSPLRPRHRPWYVSNANGKIC